MDALPNWKPLAGRALETALNRVLALDPETGRALASLEGRRIVLTFTAPALAMAFTVTDGHLRVGPAGDTEPDLAVSGGLAGFAAMLPGLGGRAAPGQVRISGDAELARRVQQLARGFDPDWQQPFVAAFGDILGVQVAKRVAALLAGARRFGGEVAASVGERLTEADGAVVGREELAAFADDVDDLRDAAERLLARAARAGVAGRA
jgi:ubiquinone biosynthesis protein UbiJ